MDVKFGCEISYFERITQITSVRKQTAKKIFVPTKHEVHEQFRLLKYMTRNLMLNRHTDRLVVSRQ
jgi:hypothetical protein